MHFLVVMWGERLGDQEVFPKEGFKDGQGFDRWRELQPYRQRDGMDNVGVIMEQKVTCVWDKLLVSGEET